MRWQTGTVRLLAAGTMSMLVLRAVAVQSVDAAPEVVRVTVKSNDLDGVIGVAQPGETVELWYRQRNFREGTSQGFSWCGWNQEKGGPAASERASRGLGGPGATSARPRRGPRAPQP